jgi:hypothetical protein
MVDMKYYSDNGIMIIIIVVAMMIMEVISMV